MRFPCQACTYPSSCVYKLQAHLKYVGRVNVSNVISAAMRQFDAAVPLFFYALTLLGTYFSTHSCCAVIPVYGYLTLLGPYFSAHLPCCGTYPAGPLIFFALTLLYTCPALRFSYRPLFFYAFTLLCSH